MMDQARWKMLTLTKGAVAAIRRSCPLSRFRRLDGAEIIEFAMITPLLLMLLLGIFWIGRAYNIYETLDRAAREGARYAVLPTSVADGNEMAESYSSVNACLSNPTYEFTNYVSPVLEASSIDPQKVQNYCQAAVILNPDTDSSMQQCGIRISFSYPLQMVIPFTTLDLSTINIAASVQMRMENQPRNSTTGVPECPGTT